MHLPIMLFDELRPEDHFGLKVLKNGYNPTNAFMNAAGEGDDEKQQQHKLGHYLKDVIILEAKEMNTIIKEKQLEDFMNKDLKDSNKKYARLLGKDARNSNFEMRKQSLLAIEKTMDSEDSVPIIASLAEKIIDFAESGNEMALSIIQEGSSTIAEYILQLVHDLEITTNDGSIILAGNGSIIRNDFFRKTLNDALQFDFPILNHVI